VAALDLLLVRHGETAWTLSGQHTSRTDLPLLPGGEAEARALGERLRGRRFAAVFCSDLERARRTAELSGFPEPTVTPLLREFDYGDYEGLTSEQIWERRPGWRIFADGCPNGETPERAHRRALRFLELLDGLEGAVLAFSHGHILRTLAVAWAGLELTAGAALALDTASISVLRAGEHGRTIQRWNWAADLWA
jgi:broad specificity phosphatase PhoE